MPTPVIRLVIDLAVHEGKLAEFEAIAKKMVAASELEAGILSYQFLLNAGRTECRLLMSFADPQAMTRHFNGPGVLEFVPMLVQHASPTHMEIYGDPGPQFRMIALAYGAEIFTAWRGFEN